MAIVTITTTGAEDARIVPAFTNYLQLPQSATAAQIKAAVGNFVRIVVLNYERDQAVASAAAAVVPINPT